MSKLNFEAKDKKLKDILFSSTSNSIRIPAYQRPYAWDEEQVSEFWNDIISEDQTYFLGSFIFNKEFESSGFIDIIDGQQRVLTTTIFIAVLRNIAKEISQKQYAELLQRQCIAFEDEEGELRDRITPGDSTIIFFKEYIQKPFRDVHKAKTNSIEEKRIKANYIYLYEKVMTLFKLKESAEQKLDALKDLRKKLGELVVIDIEIYNEEIAYEIFETVNARGVELSVSDLLKNLIFSKIKKTSDREVAKNLWREIESNVEQTNTDLKRFVRYYWMSKHKFVSDKKLYGEIKRTITDYFALINDLHKSSAWYNTILEGGEQDYNELTVKGVKIGKKVYRSIFATRLMNVTQSNVLFLSILENSDKLPMDPCNVIKTIEKFTFQYSAICKLPTNRVEKMYSKSAISLNNAINNSKDEKTKLKNVQTAFNKLQSELKSLLPSKELFNEKFKEVQYKNSDSARKLLKYILEEVDKKKSSGEYKLDFDSINLEHILPQNPEKWGLTKSDVKEYVNNIGNITLLSIKLNSSIGNEVLIKKIPELKKSEIQITKEFCQSIESDPEWNEAKINNRQQEIAKLALEHIWHF
jgi:uncharacterized protein with ParB-like and HNH nuclease domain